MAGKKEKKRKSFVETQLIDLTEEEELEEYERETREEQELIIVGVFEELGMKVVSK